MKVLVPRLWSFALLSLLSFLAFASSAVAQTQIANPVVRPSDLMEKSRARQKKTGRAASASTTSGYNYQVLYSFGATATDATGPASSLIQDAEGNLYGTTEGGGANANPETNTGGTVFKVDITGKETVIYSFCSVANCADGERPFASLIQDSASNLYGTTEVGGANDSGAVFKLAPPAQPGGNWSETVLFSFCCADGELPFSSLIQDASGNLYGTAAAGGPTDISNGTVFKLAPPAQPGGNWTETTLYSFCSNGNCANGSSPYAALILDDTGNLFSTTSGSGANSYGTVFELEPPTQSGDNWTEATLYNFDPGVPINAVPTYAGLIQDGAGNIYGTTLYSSANGGAVFKLAPPAQPGGNWTEAELYNFCSAANCTDGRQPQFAGLIQDAAGNLYGITSGGGANTSADNGEGGGTVFKLVPPTQPGGNWSETVLYSFCSAANCADGELPFAGLIQDGAGNLYGTTSSGGAYGSGTVFKLILIQTPTLTVTPSPSTITSLQALTVAVAVGGVNGDPAPTGTVTLTSGSYTSPATTLSGGGANIDIPAGSLAVGTDTLTVSYSGDIYYQLATGTASVTVVAPSFTITGAAVTVAPGATTGNTSTITVTPSGGFTGNVTLTAAVTSSPAGAEDLPTLSFGSTSPVDVTGTSAGMATLTIGTTAATTALNHPTRPGVRWHNTGGIALAFGLLLGIGIPARVRSWRTRLGVLIFGVILTGGFSACSGGGAGSGSGNHGTTPGTYTVTVTGTSGSTTATCTVTLTVQ